VLSRRHDVGGFRAGVIALGFTDPAHFSRLFKATYGYNAAALTDSHLHERSRCPPPGSVKMVAHELQKGDHMEQTVEAMSAIPGRMYDAWNRGDVAGFFADFAEDALFAELEGTIYRGRAEMIAAHEKLFATVLKGSRLVRGEVSFARIISPGTGVVHGRVGILMPGEEDPPSTRFSMQHFVTVWRNDRWLVVALENARILSLESMAALESLTAG
jgi:uncharacterized protein (TIGR02246 family)